MTAAISFPWWDYALLAIFVGAAAAIVILWIVLGVQAIRQRRQRRRDRTSLQVDEAQREKLRALAAADYAKFTTKRKNGR
jgi:uncharacterized membrane-anchored protein YhcB (DUF1043 family)